MVHESSGRAAPGAWRLRLGDLVHWRTSACHQGLWERGARHAVTMEWRSHDRRGLGSGLRWDSRQGGSLPPGELWDQG